MPCPPAQALVVANIWPNSGNCRRSSLRARSAVSSTESQKRGHQDATPPVANRHAVQCEAAE
eukprot:5373408-Prorocentrum_lima.AAC.1